MGNIPWIQSEIMSKSEKGKEVSLEVALAQITSKAEGEKTVILSEKTVNFNGDFGWWKCDCNNLD